MREQAATVYTERRANPSGWSLATVVFCCFLAGFALPRLLGGAPKAPNVAEAATVPVAAAAARPASPRPVVTAVPAPAPPIAALVTSAPVAIADAVPPAASPVAPATAAAAPAIKGDTVTTLYERTLVRESAPEGEVVARIPLGTEVHIVERQANWYHVQYGANKEGWIYRKSIGK